MASTAANIDHLTVLEGKFSAFINRAHEDRDGDRVEDLVTILQDACSLVRGADEVAPDFKTIVDRVDNLINSAVDYAYNTGELCDFMPSFAHSEAYPELDGKIVHLGELTDLCTFLSLGQLVQHQLLCFQPIFNERCSSLS